MRRLAKDEEKQDNVFQKENRLAKTRDFNLVMEHGRWVNGRFLDMRVLELAKFQDYFPKKEDPDNFKKQLRIAISVGLKVEKRAVKRNRAKRQIGEVLRLLIKDGLIRDGYYILLVIKKDVLDKNYSEISQELQLLLNRAKLLI